MKFCDDCGSDYEVDYECRLCGKILCSACVQIYKRIPYCEECIEKVLTWFEDYDEKKCVTL